MTKTHKAVLSTLAVLCLLFMGSGVAQAQECIARADNATTARAEGITEAVGGIELLCREPEGFGFGVPSETTTISIELNTQVTNQITHHQIASSIAPPPWASPTRVSQVQEPRLELVDANDDTNFSYRGAGQGSTLGRRQHDHVEDHQR